MRTGVLLTARATAPGHEKHCFQFSGCFDEAELLMRARRAAEHKLRMLGQDQFAHRAWTWQVLKTNGGVMHTYAEHL